MDSPQDNYSLEEYKTIEIESVDVDISLLRKKNKLYDLIPLDMDELGQYRHGLKANHHIGVQTHKNGQVIVEPKVKSSNILYLLNDAYKYPIPKLLEKAVLFTDRVSMQAIFVYWFLLASNDFVKKHFARNYVLKTEYMQSKIKGKLLVSQYIKTSLPNLRHTSIPCQYFDLTVNTIENQIIRYTLELCNRIVKTMGGSEVKKLIRNKLSNVMPYYSQVDFKQVYISDFKKIRYVGRFEKYKEIHDLCHLLMRSTQTSLSHGNLKFKSFVIDMNELFERFIIGVISKQYKNLQHQPPGYHYHIGVKSKNLIPDGILEYETRRIIFDAKYKALYDRDLDEENSIELSDLDMRVKNSDIYQMIGYLNSDKINADIAVLIFPKVTAAPIRIRGFNKDIFIVGIDIQNISKATQSEFMDQIADIIATE